MSPSIPDLTGLTIFITVCVCWLAIIVFSFLCCEGERTGKRGCAPAYSEVAASEALPEGNVIMSDDALSETAIKFTELMCDLVETAMSESE